MKATNTLHKMQLVQAKSNLLDSANLESLQACENLINEAIPFLGAFFDDIYKDWDTGKHLILTRDNKKFPVYATLNKDGLNPSNDKFETHKKFTDDTLVLHRIEYGGFQLTNLKSGKYVSFIPQSRKGVTIYISALDKTITSERSSSFNGVKAVSLVSLCLNKTRSLGGKNSAGKIKSTKNYVAVGFDRPEGYKEDTKTILDAYNIVKAHASYSKSKSTFRRELLSGNDLEFAANDFTIIVSLVQNGPTLNNPLKKKISKENSLNTKDNVALLRVGSSPAEMPPLKDNNKKTAAEELLEKVRAELSEEQIMAAVTIFHNIYVAKSIKDSIDYYDLNELDYTAWVIGALKGWFKQGLKKGFNISQINYKLTKLNRNEKI